MEDPNLMATVEAEGPAHGQCQTWTSGLIVAPRSTLQAHLQTLMMETGHH